MTSLCFSHCALWVSVVLAGSVVAGCPDPDASFDAFTARAKLVPPPPVGACGPTVTSVHGTFFFALSTQVARNRPFVFLTTVTTESGGLMMNLQPLSADDRATSVGTAIAVGPFPIAADGSFVGRLPTLAIVADANPISASELEAEVTLRGTVCENFICGSVDGTMTKPSALELTADKSSFTLERVEPAGEYPEPPEINCSGDLAVPVGSL
jgi:hypothetical protein